MKTLIKERIANPSEFERIIYNEGMRPKPFQEILPEMVKERVKCKRYTYNGSSKLFDVVTTEKGETLYLMNSRFSERESTHEALEIHFNLNI